MKPEFKHLKWSLMSRDGLSEKEADRRIEQIKQAGKKKNER